MRHYSRRDKHHVNGGASADGPQPGEGQIIQQLALRARQARAFAKAFQRRQPNRRQQPDDGHDDEQLDECERRAKHPNSAGACAARSKLHRGGHLPLLPTQDVVFVHAGVGLLLVANQSVRAKRPNHDRLVGLKIIGRSRGAEEAVKAFVALHQ